MSSASLASTIYQPGTTEVTMLLFVFAFMIWIATPLSCFWAMSSVRKHPTWTPAISKLAFGMVMVFLLIGEDASNMPVRFANALLTSMAALTAAVGFIDLVALKLDALQARAKGAGQSDVDAGKS